MRSFVSLRLTAQLCLIGAVFCLFAPLRAQWPVFALLPALALAAGLLAAPRSRAFSRLALGLLPALALPAAVSPWGLAAGGVMAVYAAVYLALGRFAPELWQYRREAAFTLALSAVIALLSGLGSARSLISAILSGFGFLGTLLALRARRLAPGASAVWQVRNAVCFALPLAGGAVLGAAVWALLPLLRRLIALFGALLGGAAVLWNTLWSWLMGRVDSVGEDFFEETPFAFPPNRPEPAVETEAVPSGGPAFGLPEVELPRKWILIVLGVLGAAALLALLIWLLRRGGKAGKPGQVPTDFSLAPQTQTPTRRPRRRRREKVSTDRTRIREAYREYLAFLSRSGVRRSPAHTTEEISAGAAAVLTTGDEALRELYRLARYSPAAPTPEQAEAAESLLAELVREENLRSRN